MSSIFAGKTAMITGAASGIGAATAHHLCVHGAKRLILIDCDQARLKQNELRADVQYIAGDVSDEALWTNNAHLMDDIDFAVLNAGIAHAGAIVDMPFTDWRKVMSINLDGIFLGLKASLKAMMAHKRGGAIVLTASATGIKAQPNVAAYGVSKAAIIHLGKVAAVEAAAHNIRVNIIAPGGVKTPIWQASEGFNEMAENLGGIDAAFEAIAKAGQPLPRFAEAKETAAQIAMMLDDTISGTMTGNVLICDGGYSL